MPVAWTFTWTDLAWLALSIFLIVVGLATGYMFLRLAGTFGRLSSLVSSAEREAMPVVHNLQTTVTLVNENLEQVTQVTSSAASAVGAADTAARAVSIAVTKPVQKASGVAAGISEGVSAFMQEHDLRKAADVGAKAAARREQELVDELKAAREKKAPAGPPPPPPAPPV